MRLPILLLAGLLAAAPAAAAGNLETRYFQLKWRSVEDAAEVVRPQMSEDASIQIQPKLKALTVTDWPANLRRVEQVLASFDVPPHAVDVTLTIVRATKAAAPRPIGEELRSVKDSVDKLVEYSDYEVLGKAQLQGVEGTPLAATLGKDGEYRVSFRIGTADDKNGIVQLDDLSLDRRRSAAGAKPDFATLLRLTYNAQSGRKVVLGATRASARDTGVLLVLEAVIQPAAAGQDVAGGRR